MSRPDRDRWMNAVQKTSQDLRRLPGPKIWPLFGNVLQLRPRQLHHNYSDWADRYGPMYKIKLGQQWVVVISDYEVLIQAAKNRPDLFARSSRLQGVVRHFIGENLGVFFVEGERWRAQRRMVMSSLSPSHVRNFFPTLLKVAQRLQNRWHATAAAPGARPVDLQKDWMRYTVDVISGLAFGQDINTLEAGPASIQHHLDKILPALHRRMTSPWAALWPVRPIVDHTSRKHLHFIRQEIDAIIAQAKQRLQDHPEERSHPQNLLQAMLISTEQEGSLGHEDIVGNILVMLIAGEDTTANTLSWLLYFLFQNQAQLQKLEAEIGRVFQGPIEQLTMEHLDEMPYLAACLEEIMRLKPVAPIIHMEALQDTVLQGVRIPKGVLIGGVFHHAAQQNQHFDEAEKFMPERWLEQGIEPHNKRCAMPFGSGPRMCPGRYLAILEMKVAMVMLLTQFSLDFVGTKNSQIPAERFALTVMPVGLKLKLSPRQRPPKPIAAKS